jgi:hypothetical protein
VAQLEEKLDGIVSLLTASQQIQQLSSSARMPATPEGLSGPSSATATTSATVSSRTDHDKLPPWTGCALRGEVAADSAGPGAYGTDNRADPLDLELFPGMRMSPDQAESYLALYRHEIVPNFPFVPIDPGVTAFDLHAKSRLLFWTIMSVTAPLGAPIQLEFKRWFRAWIAEHMIKGSEKRLEILQAILLHLGWYVVSRGGH